VLILDQLFTCPGLRRSSVTTHRLECEAPVFHHTLARSASATPPAAGCPGRPVFLFSADPHRDAGWGNCRGERLRTLSPRASTYVTMEGMDAERVVFEGFEGLHLVADVRGEADAWPVLFLHGGGQTRHAWGSTAETVATDGWRTVTLDLRGHGESDWAPNGDYSFTAFCADCVAVVDQLGRPPVLVGASLGGMSAMLAEGTSDRVVSCGLVLVDITPKTNAVGIERIKTFMQSGVDGFDTLEEAAAAIAAYTPQRTRQVNPSGLRKVLRQRGDRWYWHWDPRVIGQDRTEVVPDRLAGLLDVATSNIHVPTLLVRGLLSDVVTQEGVDDLLAQIPGATVVGVDGAAHMIAGDRNDAFSDAVIAFLRDRIQPTIGS
jgi:pimeloyl-ACP methyl ester carboxylesterase